MGGVALLGMVDGPWFMCAIILLAFVLALDSEKRAVAAEEALAALRSDTLPDSRVEGLGFDEPALPPLAANVVPLRRPVSDTGR